MSRLSFSILMYFFFLGCSNDPTPPKTIAAYALNGAPLYAATPSAELLKKYEDRKKAYLKNVHSLDNLIWYGRFAAYKGDYDEAIKIFSSGIKKAPNDARFYRHRGHRYITIRKFDLAIADLEKAAALIQGSKNQIEPDGMPNAQNIPVSTLHGNIYYHLGLAYYLTDRLPQALEAYLQCLETSSLSDNLVSATHWIYMIFRKLERREEAQEILKPIRLDMDIIENQSYHQLCLFYKGILSESDLLKNQGGAAANDAVKYGIANVYNCNNQKAEGRKRTVEILKGDSWGSFGYIAAEADLYRVE